MPVNILRVVALVMILSSSADAMPCHCFPVRKYEPARPAAADPYFLVTTQNSFFALTAELEKKDVVIAKQKPSVTSENLWVAHWVGKNAGNDPGGLLKARQNHNSWKAALAVTAGQSRGLPAEFLALLGADANDGQLSAFVVNRLLLEKGLISRQHLEKMRQEGADDQQAILAAVLARKAGQLPVELFRRVKRGETTWGALLQQAGVDGGDMVKEIKSLLGKATAQK